MADTIYIDVSGGCGLGDKSPFDNREARHTLRTVGKQGEVSGVEAFLKKFGGGRGF